MYKGDPFPFGVSADFPPVTADPSGESGEVLAADPEDLPLQYIDAGDLAAWMIASVERNLTGTFNTLSPVGDSTMSALLEANRTITNSDAQFIWVAIRNARSQSKTDAEIAKWIFISMQINLSERRQRRFR